MSEIINGAITGEPAAEDDAGWQALLEHRADASSPLADTSLHALYGPLCTAHHAASQSESFVVGHLAQSLDGYIATSGGVSRWLSGAEDLLHTHRMRALADAVVVGANTVVHDDPQLTVRRCAGANPVRVMIDPERRLDGSQRIFKDGAAPTLLLAAADRVRAGETLGQAEIVPVARSEHGLDPHEIGRVLARRGLRWLFIEGGGVTVSRFLAAGALQRLQLTIAPLLLGSGRPGVVMPELTDLRNSLRPRTRHFALGVDIMVECDFT